MKKFKEIMKKIGRYLWEFFKAALPSLLMYCCAGLLILINSTGEKGYKWDGTSIGWTIGALVAAAAYNGLMAWHTGGSHYEMLVSGNIQRMSAGQVGGGYKISAHKEAKEYRLWKGIVIGVMTSLIAIVFGIILGCMQPQIDVEKTSKGVGAFVLIAMFVDGWAFIPFYLMSQCGISVSYFMSLLLALLPIIVTGVFYVVGAYARRSKRLHEQLIAQKQAEAEASKVKKINYGGLPGTKPKKRK